MFTGVFRDRKPSDAGASGPRESLARLLQSQSLQPYQFVRHALIGPFVVEHVCKERSVIVEVHRGDTVAGERLRARMQFFQSLGFKVVLVTRGEILKHPHAVLERVRVALD
jgi:very-short-patch-repair endonuclease